VVAAVVVVLEVAVVADLTLGTGSLRWRCSVAMAVVLEASVVAEPGMSAAVAALAVAGVLVADPGRWSLSTSVLWIVRCDQETLVEKGE